MPQKSKLQNAQKWNMKIGHVKNLNITLMSGWKWLNWADTFSVFVSPHDSFKSQIMSVFLKSAPSLNIRAFCCHFFPSHSPPHLQLHPFYRRKQVPYIIYICLAVLLCVLFNLMVFSHSYFCFLGIPSPSHVCSLTLCSNPLSLLLFQVLFGPPHCLRVTCITLLWPLALSWCTPFALLWW